MSKRPGVPRKMPEVGAGDIKGGGYTKYGGIQYYRHRDGIDMTQPLKAPMPYPGGKSDIATAVWRRFGNPPNYVEPFAGSAAMLLGRPGGASGTETVNDLDGLLVNALRAITLAPDETAAWCDWPVSEADLTSRHLWLKGQREELTARLFGDPLYCDPQAAGWWLWGIASWIGDGWCVADGPWVSVDGRLVDRRTLPKEEQTEGVSLQIPELGAGTGAAGGKYTIKRGVQRERYRASVPRRMPEVGAAGQSRPSGPNALQRGIHRYRAGVPRQMPGMTPNVVTGVTTLVAPTALAAYFAALSDRLRRVRFLCGDWRRAVKDSITVNHGATALFMDPEYPPHEHGMAYHQGEQGDRHVWYEAQAWAVEHGNDPRLKIAFCGYWSEETDALFPATWARFRWEARGGYSNQSKDGRGRKNAKRECVWFNSSCIDPANDYAGTLFEELAL